jgi:hypothetical protein
MRCRSVRRWNGFCGSVYEIVLTAIADGYVARVAKGYWRASSCHFFCSVPSGAWTATADTTIVFWQEDAALAAWPQWRTHCLGGKSRPRSQKIRWAEMENDFGANRSEAGGRRDDSCFGGGEDNHAYNETPTDKAKVGAWIKPAIRMSRRCSGLRRICGHGPSGTFCGPTAELGVDPRLVERAQESRR